jgi:hypothetical protein
VQLTAAMGRRWLSCRAGAPGASVQLTGQADFWHPTRPEVPRSRKGSADSVAHARSGRRDALRNAKSHPAGCLFVTRGWMYLHWLRLLCTFGGGNLPRVGALLRLVARISGQGQRPRDGRKRVSAWFHHWIIADFYDPIWPNIAASILCAVWAVRRVKIHLKRHHQIMMSHFGYLHEKTADPNNEQAIRA